MADFKMKLKNTKARSQPNEKFAIHREKNQPKQKWKKTGMGKEREREIETEWEIDRKREGSQCKKKTATKYVGQRRT